eukprot:58712-Prymnesium_polylepis.1
MVQQCDERHHGERDEGHRARVEPQHAPRVALGAEQPHKRDEQHAYATHAQHVNGAQRGSDKPEE